MKKPVVSIIITTYYKSAETLEISLQSIANQKCSKDLFEVIIADNCGGEVIASLAKKSKARLIEINGKPSQLCRQINKGASFAKGKYILLQDHDIELDSNLIGNFVKMVANKKSDIDAWYIPYKIVARGELLTKVRNFEEGFYRNSVIAAPRLIRKSIFSRLKWDPNVSAGAPDWDFTIQMKLIGAKFDYLEDYFYHHEEQMSLWGSISKKVIYSEGGEIYKRKWQYKNLQVYKSIVVKQYDPLYRLFGIFVENGKWRKLLNNIPLYILFVMMKISIAAIYFYHLNTQKRTSATNS
jgi:glycosyltransferase involved in cell wall biosynthesis